jgi:hypothetical protein
MRLIAAIVTMPPAKSDRDTGSGTVIDPPASAAPLAIIVETTMAAVVNILRICPLLIRRNCENAEVLARRHLRRRYLTTAMAATPPAKSDMDTGSGTVTGVPASAAPLAMIVVSTIAAVVKKLRIGPFPHSMK